MWCLPFSFLGAKLNTTDVVTRICQTNPDLTRPDALSFVKEALLLLTKTERASAYYLDTSTGNFPYLSTTAGTFLYTIDTTTIPIWKVAYIVTDYLDQAPNNDTRMLVEQPQVYNLPSAWRNMYTEVILLGRKYLTVPFKGTLEMGTTAPKVQFLTDPTTAATTYRVVGYKAEAEATSESIDIPIPENLISTCLIPACLSLIDATFNGRYIEQVQYIEQNIRPKVLYAMNKDDSNLVNFTVAPMGY